MRKIALTSVLVLTLTVSAYAGDMGYPVVSPPPPPPSSATQVSTEPIVDGEIGQPQTVSVTGVALSLLETLLGLF